MAKIGIEEHTEGYYIHIHIKGPKGNLPYRINVFMIKNGSFDPKSVDEFLMQPGVEYTDVERRQLAGGISDSYYQLWKVREAFPCQAFEQHIREVADELSNRPKVRILYIRDNNHTGQYV